MFPDHDQTCYRYFFLLPCPLILSNKFDHQKWKLPEKSTFTSTSKLRLSRKNDTPKSNLGHQNITHLKPKLKSYCDLPISQRQKRECAILDLGSSFLEDFVAFAYGIRDFWFIIFTAQLTLGSRCGLSKLLYI